MPNLDATHHRGGSVLLVVIITLVCIVLFMDAASQTLHIVDRQLDHLDARQQRKLSPPPTPSPTEASSGDTQK